MKKALTIVFLLGFATILWAQPQPLPCEREGNQLIKKLVGSWVVKTKDRTASGQYEENTGVATISNGMQGCSIRESYNGTYKGNRYAVETTMLMTGAMEVQRIYYDSEHANAMVFDGRITKDRIELLWLKNPERKKMQVKFELSMRGDQYFEWKTELSTDYGKSWSLTHHWQYSRPSAIDITNTDHVAVKSTIDNYHQGLANGNSDQVIDALSNQFMMFNGNYSNDISNWQAHMFLADEDLMRWPTAFVNEAGPYQNSYEICSIYTRGNAALVSTLDTGSNKFRKWTNEKTVWLLGKVGEQWKIVGYYLKDISNPD